MKTALVTALAIYDSGSPRRTVQGRRNHVDELRFDIYKLKQNTHALYIWYIQTKQLKSNAPSPSPPLVVNCKICYNCFVQIWPFVLLVNDNLVWCFLVDVIRLNLTCFYIVDWVNIVNSLHINIVLNFEPVNFVYISYTKPVSRSVIAKENRRMLCGLFNMAAGFFIIITQNSEFSKNDRAAINPNIPATLPSAWRLWSSKVGVDSPLLELFRRGENVFSASMFDIFE